MAALSSDLRSLLEKAVVRARDVSERAASAAVDTLGVGTETPFAALSDDERKLRRALRARARQLGEGSVGDGLHLLVEEVAYEQWHQMLFARFLAENGLLMHPSGVAVTLEECGELAPEEGEPDAWSLAARYASAMLPGIFRIDDPSSRVRFAPEGRIALESIIAGLAVVVFQADGALGWVYQFWQSKAKDAVNASGKKIGAEELPAVTQLFTEDYMVRFLLENSLGAWWASRHPESPLVNEWQYLRRLKDGTPIAGRFDSWPDRAAQVTMMDPCCGSGHFLVVAFDMLRKMRMEEEGFSENDTGDAVLRDNLHGLELELRCTQIATFALAFAAWKSGGYRQLPTLNIACTGIPVTGQIEEWTKLAGDDYMLRTTLEWLHSLFKNGPELGSLINPAQIPQRDRMFMAEYSSVEPLLHQTLTKEDKTGDPTAIVYGGTAHSAAHAASLLARANYILVATNVPYLSRIGQDKILASFSEHYYNEGKADLATVFLQRCKAFLASGGT